MSTSSPRYIGYDATIDYVDELRVDEFNERYARVGRPVVFKGLTKRWPASSRWTLSYLRRVFGRVRVGLNWPYYSPKTISFAEYLTLLEVGDPKSEKLYLGQQRIAPRLAKDVLLPKFVQPSDQEPIYLWFGSKGARTPLHRDEMHNLHCQVRGRKRFTLFSPIFEDCLYARPRHPIYGTYSLVDIESPDLARFPKYRSAVPLEVILEPGDALFLPIYWWHQVTCLDLSISVNRWWSAPFELWMRPESESEFQSKEFFFHHLAKYPDYSKFPDTLGMAQWFHAQHYQNLADILVANYVERLVTSLLGRNRNHRRQVEQLARLERRGFLEKGESRLLRKLSQVGSRASSQLGKGYRPGVDVDRETFDGHLETLRQIAKRHRLKSVGTGL